MWSNTYAEEVLFHLKNSSVGRDLDSYEINFPAPIK